MHRAASATGKRERVTGSTPISMLCCITPELGHAWAPPASASDPAPAMQ